MKRSHVVSDPAYPQLKQLVIEHTGLAYYADKDVDLASRILQRLEAKGVGDCASYLRILDEEEMDALIGELTIGETYFFRQAEHFDILRQVVFPDLIERNRSSRRLRIWSAGCATGAEPYSVALLLHEMADMIPGWDISILGTDLNREFLAGAREARFSQWALRAGPKDLARYFQADGKHWVLRPEYKSQVSFQHHNLVKDPIPQPFDLILCRNVMIYFNPQIISATVDRLHNALVEDGWLLVGHAEPGGEVFKAFRPVMACGVTVYRKSNSVPLPVAAFVAETPAPVFPPAKLVKIAPKPWMSVEEARLLADRGQWQAAAASCRKLLEIDGTNAAAHFTLALILEHTGSPEQAQRELRRAIYLDRDFALAHYHLGLSLQGSRQAGRAAKAFEHAVEILEHRPDGERLEHGDGITVAQLKELARMHLELLGKV